MGIHLREIEGNRSQLSERRQPRLFCGGASVTVMKAKKSARGGGWCHRWLSSGSLAGVNALSLEEGALGVAKGIMNGPIKATGGIAGGLICHPRKS